MCTPGSQGQALFLFSFVPNCWLEVWSFSRPIRNSVYERKYWASRYWLLLRITGMSLGHSPLALAICGRRGLENRLPSPKGKGEMEGHTGCGFLEQRADRNGRHQGGMIWQGGGPRSLASRPPRHSCAASRGHLSCGFPNVCDGMSPGDFF